jgi:hypothetical protein
MRYGHTVTATTVTTTTDDLGNSTETTATTVADDILFAPEGIQESTDADTPRVIGDASLYGPLPALNSDDTILHQVACCDGADFAHGTWQVVGGSKGWGRGDKAVPIRRTAAA